MSNADRWLLPDGVDEVLPPEAEAMEQLRRQILDLFKSWGFELVMPPMIEFLDSLLTGTGTDLDLKTFKLTDQVSGRLMGVRADMTPQVARIDAHSLNRSGDVRLCYAGTVLHAKADHMLASRTPVSVGAELFGDTKGQGDLEIVSLMVEALANVAGEVLHLELGDVGIFRELLSEAGLPGRDQEQLFDLIQSKALPDIGERVADLGLSQPLVDAIIALPELCGGPEVLDQARLIFSAFPLILARLDNLEAVAEGVERRYPGLAMNYDLSELRGYNYHTGIVFAAYRSANGQRLAKGGRYDDVGKVFGRARGATGFDIDLRVLARGQQVAKTCKTILAPSVADEEAGRWQKIRELRAAGNIVIEASTGPADAVLEMDNGAWVVRERAASDSN